MKDWTGKTLGGRYRIERRLGAGGMGVVYEATQTDLGRRVALKVVGDDAKSDLDLARFEREARAAAALGHPHIVQVNEFRKAEGDEPAFIVMELLEGRSFADLVREEWPVDPKRAVRIALQMLSALGAAHRANLVHRDVKPANVMLLPSPAGDLVKIVDFGLAKPASNVGTVEGAGPVSEAGAVLGTLAYMAPEQARGETVDRRADLYAVAASLYYALTGRSPIAARDAAAISAILYDPPAPIADLRPEIDPTLAWIVMKGLEKDPARRHQTAEEMSAALETWLVSVTATAVVGAKAPPPMKPSADAMASTVTSSTVTSSTVIDGDVDAPPVPSTSRIVEPPPRSARSRLFFVAMSLTVIAAGVVGLISMNIRRDDGHVSPPVAEASSPMPIASVAPVLEEVDAEVAETPVIDAAPSAKPVVVAVRSAAPAKSAAPPKLTAGQPCVSSGDCGKDQVCRESICTCMRGSKPLNCGGACIDSPYDSDNCGACGNLCPPDEHCWSGKCKKCEGTSSYPAMKVCEPHSCVDLDRDSNHCGGCGKKCAKGEWCQRGRCEK